MDPAAVTNSIDPNTNITPGFVLTIDANDLNPNNQKSPKESFTWTDDTTKLLVSEYKAHVKNIGRHPHLQTKKDLWDLITAEINKHGYNLTPVQTRNRLTTLGRAFKKKMRQGGNSSQRIVKDTELQSDLNEIFLLKPFDEFASPFDSETTETNVSQFGDASAPDPLTDLTSLSNASFIFNTERDASDLYKWDHRTTELLFNVYDEVNGNDILMNQFKTKMNMWNHITERLNEFGFIFSSLQVQNRIKTIIRAYKRYLMKNQNHQGHEISIFPFEEQIKRVINRHFNGTLSPKKECKTVFGDSLDDFDIGDKDDIANVIVSNQMSASCMSPNVSTTVVSSAGDERTLLQELRLLREEEQQFRRDFAAFQNQHVTLKREENSLLKENNQLLKCLIEKLTHGGSQPL